MMHSRVNHKRSAAMTLLFCCSLLSGCAEGAKKLTTKPYTVKFTVEAQGPGATGWIRMSDGKGNFRNEMTMEGSRNRITIFDQSKRSLYTLYPEEAKFTTVYCDPSTPLITLGDEGPCLDPPRAPFWTYLKSGKQGKYNAQLWRQILKTSDSTRISEMWYGESTGCPLAIEYWEEQAPNKKMRFVLSDYSAETPAAENFQPPSDYKEEYH
ncbi:MAG: hypothetical protein K2X27_08355 [Candidatus Obscuribacterales bacterium]|nr:hypothetical protein [Candidatus Obscuribacterales bacterium]